MNKLYDPETDLCGEDGLAGGADQATAVPAVGNDQVFLSIVKLFFKVYLYFFFIRRYLF